jgi:PAS domain S-box-containing protein
MSAYERNSDILSLGVRTSSGRLIAQAGPHQKLWETSKPDASTLRVDAPIFLNGRKWGQVEFSFSQVAGLGLTEILLNTEIRLALFISLASLLGIMFVLRRVFRYLVRSTVVPDRFKSLLDTLAEGVLVLDPDERIVIVNHSFCGATGLSEKQILGRKISRIRWKQPTSEQPPAEFPWRAAARNRKTQSGNFLTIHCEGTRARHFVVSASPIIDDDKHSRGVLVSFDDVTMRYDRNGKMADTVKELKNAGELVQGQNTQLSATATKHAA